MPGKKKTKPVAKKKPIATAKKPLTVKKALKLPTGKRRIKRNIAFCERALKVLETPEARAALLKGELPLQTKKMCPEVAMMEVLAEVTPDEEFIKIGIWLPNKEFFAKGNKFLKLLLYYGYWRGGPYFMPVHAATHLLTQHIPDRLRRRAEIKAGKFLQKRFSKEGKLIVTEKDIDELIKEFHAELNRNKKALDELK